MEHSLEMDGEIFLEMEVATKTLQEIPRQIDETKPSSHALIIIILLLITIPIIIKLIIIL